MRIVHKKDNHQNRVAQWVCHNCGSTIESNIHEGTYVDDQRDGSYVKVQCPNCGAQNTVASHLYRLPINTKTIEDYYNK